MSFGLLRRSVAYDFPTFQILNPKAEEESTVILIWVEKHGGERVFDLQEENYWKDKSAPQHLNNLR